jgi:hypothetical protein
MQDFFKFFFCAELRCAAFCQRTRRSASSAASQSQIGAIRTRPAHDAQGGVEAV